LIKRYYQLSRVDRELPIPFTPLQKPIDACRFGLVTSGGLYHRGHDRPFDAERERREPAWGDPGFRVLPTDMDPAEVGVSDPAGPLAARGSEGARGDSPFSRSRGRKGLEAGRRVSHPETPAPIAARMGRHIGKVLIGLRRRT